MDKPLCELALIVWAMMHHLYLMRTRAMHMCKPWRLFYMSSYLQTITGCGKIMLMKDNTHV